MQVTPNTTEQVTTSTLKPVKKRRLISTFNAALALCCILGFGGLTTTAQAITLPELQQTLSSQPLVRGDFAQTRKMEMFDAPLTSQGHFLLAEQHGLLWQQAMPFPVSLVLTKDKLSQQFGDQAAQVMSASDNPMVFYFSHIFLSLFKGDTRQLTEQFNLTLSDKSNGRWQLLLTPKAAPLNAVFKAIALDGKTFIDHLILTEVRGDQTTITFSNQRTTPSDLTAEEQRAFQF
ncbi:LolA family protein [Photobacterium kasasachensis]|uniref:LolA family protein n=1 Tax=Photobacterium kasasachensis TaxID=2910240 RepID=UPI003D0CAC7F